MKMRRLLISGFLVVGAVFAARELLTEREAPPKKRSNIRYRFTVTNETNRAIPNLTVQFFAPAKRSASQHTEALEASEQFSVREGEGQNQEVVLTTLLPPYGTKVVSLSATVAGWEKPRVELLPEPDVFRAPERWIESEDPSIAELARTLKREDVLATSVSIFEWIAKHIEREPLTKTERGALHALHKRSGDCTEHAYLFVALARAAGVPARAVSGFIVTRDQVLKPSEYHNWAEFHDGQTWRIADPHRNVFDSEYEHYVKFRNLGGSSSSAFAESAKRFSAVNAPGVSIRMD